MKTNKSQKNTHTEWKVTQMSDLITSVVSGKSDTKNEFGVFPIYGSTGIIGYKEKSDYSGNKILVARVGANAGTVNMVSGDYCVSDNTLIVSYKPEVNIDFQYHYLIKNDLHKLVFGSGQPLITGGHFKKITLLLPPFPEQNRIVSVLETWDKVIENLNKKIKIKKQTKKVLMKNLLTGKKRLAGFKDKWETKEVGELLDYEQPNKYIVESTDYEDTHKTPVLTANKGFILGYTDETIGIYKSHPVIIFDDFTMDNKFVDFDFKIKSSAIKILTPKNKDVNLKFVFERIQLINVIIGQHRRHYLSEYQYITIDTPNIKEQSAIANILTSVDKEITELERKLRIIKEQKKYLLNNLITGAIRTPENLSVKV